MILNNCLSIQICTILTQKIPCKLEFNSKIDSSDHFTQFPKLNQSSKSVNNVVAVEVFTHTCIVLSEFSSVPHSVWVLKTAVHNPFCVIREKVLAQCKLDLAHSRTFSFYFLFPITQRESKCSNLEAEKKKNFICQNSIGKHVSCIRKLFVQSTAINSASHSCS